MPNGFNSVIVQKDRLLPGIHGLRGIAALAVVLFHLKHLSGIALPDFFGFIGRDFGFSVHLFFILSAFSLCYSTEWRAIRGGAWLQEYFVKRFFRIAPLFYFIIALEIARQQIKSGGIIPGSNSILLETTFTFGFVPHSDFVWGGWSVGVEMIFYVIFPVLLLTLRTHRSALVFLLASIVICGSIRSALHMQHLSTIPQAIYDWSYFAPASNICFFAIGIYAYRIAAHVKGSILATRIIAILTVITIGSLVLFNAGKYLNGSWRNDIIVWGLAFMGLCIWQSVSPSRFIANWIFEYLGERSFSIYLLHPVIIDTSKVHIARTYKLLEPYIGLNAFFVCAILILAFILFIAELTYTLIEVPGIRFGRELTNKKHANKIIVTTIG